MLHNKRREKEGCIIVYNYNEVNKNLLEQVAVVTFLKKNHDVRVMVCSADLISIIRMYNAHYSNEMQWRASKCNEENGLIAVVDLEKMDVRTINVNTMGHLEYKGRMCEESVADAKEYAVNMREALEIDDGVSGNKNATIEGMAQSEGFKESEKKALKQGGMTRVSSSDINDVFNMKMLY